MPIEMTAKQNFYSDAVGTKMKGDVFQVDNQEIADMLTAQDYAVEGNQQEAMVKASATGESQTNQTSVAEPQEKNASATQDIKSNNVSAQEAKQAETTAKAQAKARATKASDAQ